MTHPTNQGKTFKHKPPVVVVLGHVDHGKTTLLDAVRNTQLARQEQGQITQHIGASEIAHKGRAVVFIDTPGHEAFQKIRSRGAGVADLAVLVVSATEGVQAQTIESYKVIQESKIPCIIAITKIDLKGADVSKTKKSLLSHNILIEGMGGDIPVIEVSAVKKQGIEELLDMILLVSDLLEVPYLPSSPLKAVVIESHLDQQRGIEVTLLIKQGTLKLSDKIACDGCKAEIRCMEDCLGKNCKEALPSKPVRILGFETPPVVGSQCFLKLKNDRTPEGGRKDKSEITTAALQGTGQLTLGDPSSQKFFYLVIKADTYGSLEALHSLLEKLSPENVQIKVIEFSIGEVSERDVKRLSGFTGAVVGFGVGVTPSAKRTAERLGIPIKIFSIIYELEENLVKLLEQLIPPEIIKEDIGEFGVVALFGQSSDKDNIIGGKVTSGFLESGNEFVVLRKSIEIAKGKILNVQKGKQKVDKAEQGEECGLLVESTRTLKKGDNLKVLRTKQKKVILKFSNKG